MFSQHKIEAFRTAWPELPPSIRELFSRDEENAYRTGAPYFKRLAEESCEPQLTKLMENLEPDKPLFVDVEQRDGREFIVWFSFTFLRLANRPRFRLPRAAAVEKYNMPDRLRRLYSAFGGIDVEQEFQNGFLPPERFASVSDTVNQIIPSADGEKGEGLATVFFAYGNGDVACFRQQSNDLLVLSPAHSKQRSIDINAFIESALGEMTAEPDWHAYFATTKLKSGPSKRRKK